MAIERESISRETVHNSKCNCGCQTIPERIAKSASTKYEAAAMTASNAAGKAAVVAYFAEHEMLFFESMYNEAKAEAEIANAKAKEADEHASEYNDSFLYYQYTVAEAEKMAVDIADAADLAVNAAAAAAKATKILNTIRTAQDATGTATNNIEYDEASRIIGVGEDDAYELAFTSKQTAESAKAVIEAGVVAIAYGKDVEAGLTDYDTTIADAVAAIETAAAEIIVNCDAITLTTKVVELYSIIASYAAAKADRLELYLSMEVDYGERQGSGDEDGLNKNLHKSTLPERIQLLRHQWFMGKNTWELFTPSSKLHQVGKHDRR